MACFHPLQAFEDESGAVHFVERQWCQSVRTIELPCGRCIGCRLNRSREWAVRCQHEAQLHDRNCVLLLTYDDEHVPVDGSLRYVDFQRFMRRLRLVVGKVRFFMCGEYGENLGRPHYHCVLFGCDFDDRVRVGESSSGFALYRSKVLDGLWDLGNASVSAFSFQSAAYVARYITKKVTGDLSEYWYEGRVAEFCHMSLRPGIGSGWLDRFAGDVSDDGRVVVGGREVSMPRYYGKYLKRKSPEWFENLQYRRELERRRHVEDNTEERLKVRELVAKSRNNLYRRS